ncbi:MAG TPA: hemolysin family protein [Gemmatimonadaceae bacterium]|nr:hemolysin family protein [Gemmatimonadaceae bacterium]
MRIVAILVLLLLNAYFVAVEFALVRARRTRLEAMARTGDRLAHIALKATANLSPLLSASQLGITIASLALGHLAEPAFHGWLDGIFHNIPVGLSIAVQAGIIASVAIGIVTFLHVVFGELAPRTMALTHPEDVSRWLAPPLVAFEKIVRPFTWTLNVSATGVLRLFGQKGFASEEGVHSPEELRMLVEQSQESGALDAADATMLEGVFEFSEKNARKVMTPRTEIDAIPHDATLADVLAIVEESGRSRYPVYEDTLDNIVGLILTRDLIPVLQHRPATFSPMTIMRPIHVVPGSREVEEVLADFKRLKEHMAVVLDEYGGTAGVVTMEDLLEEIVGEILDEYDEIPDVPARENADTVIVPGNSDISELNSRFGLSVPEEGNYTTIGGFVFGKLGRLPTVGDRITAGNAVFTVREMDHRRIDSLAVDLHSAGDRRKDYRMEDGSG